MPGAVGEESGGHLGKERWRFCSGKKSLQGVMEVGGVFQKLCSEKGLELRTMGRAAAALEHPKSGL